MVASSAARAMGLPRNRKPMPPPPTNVVFDLGNVLIGWDPRRLYRPLFGDPREMEWFLQHVCTDAWNLEQDRGRDFATAVELLVRAHPAHLHALIRAYDERWLEMLSGEIAGSVAILEQLHAAQVPLYAITNWNQDKFRQTRGSYGFLERFVGIVVSGEERLLKPDPAIYHTLCSRYQLRAEHCVFIDDSAKNVAGARAVGMQALRFETPEQLAVDLRALGFPVQK
jgi:2-haloacid dehalogenase